MLAYKGEDRISSRKLLKICKYAIKICDDAELLLKNPTVLEVWRKQQGHWEDGKGGWWDQGKISGLIELVFYLQ